MARAVKLSGKKRETPVRMAASLVGLSEMAHTPVQESVSDVVEHVILACEALGEAPEPTSGSHGIDHRAEVWSMGATAYELLAGRPPLRGGAHLPLRTLRPDVPPVLAAIVERCLMPDPGARFRTVTELAGSLRGRVTLLPITAASFRTTMPSERPVALDARADGPTLRQTILAALAGPLLLGVMAAVCAIVIGVSPAQGATESARAPAVVQRLTAKVADSAAREKVVDGVAQAKPARPHGTGARRH